MATWTISKKLNVSPYAAPLVIQIKQYTSDFALKLQLYSTVGDLDIPAGATTKIRGTKRDGNGYELTGTRIGHTCTFSGTKAQMQQMTAAHGRCVFEVVVEHDGKELITASFYLEVQRSAMDAGTVTSESIIEEFTDFQSKITAAQAAATAAEAQADRAEAAAESIDFGIDSTPTQGSSNAVSSGGVKSALDAVTAQIPAIDNTLTQEGQAADAKKTGDEISDLKEDLTPIKDQFAEINGTLFPPDFAIGSRYVQNGLDKWAENTTRLSFKQGTFISLKQGDIVTKDATFVYTFSGGYSTDNGSTFTTISNGFGPYEAPSDGLYFFNLVKANSGTWTESEAKEGYKYIKFERAGNMKDDISEINTDINSISADVGDIKEAVGCVYGQIPPTDYYALTNTGKGLNYLGQLTDDANQDTSDFIELTDNFYDMCRVVQNQTKYGLGSICYYNASKRFIRRDQPGTSYNFTIYNGEVVAWLGIDKTVENAKYIRYAGDNRYGFKYWVVYNGNIVTKLDEYQKLPFYGKKIVNFGDSIFGNTRPPKDVSTYLAELTGATVYNCGFGGCEMSTHASADYTPFSMCSLADAIATNTWTDQETAAALSGMPAYFTETVALLKTINFNTVDIVTISYATNDWNNGSPLDNGGDSDMSYFADALRYSLKTLLTAFPNLHVFVCTPIYRFFVDANNDFIDDCSTHTNSHGKTLTDFADKIKEVADVYFVPCIDNYHIGMNRYDRSQYFNANDGTHPKPTGNYLIARNIAKNLF